MYIRNEGEMLNSSLQCDCLGHGQGMVTAAQAQQQLMEAGVGVSVEGGAGVEMMVMDSLDPTLLQMKTEVSSIILILWCVCMFFTGVLF